MRFLHQAVDDLQAVDGKGHVRIRQGMQPSCPKPPLQRAADAASAEQFHCLFPTNGRFQRLNGRSLFLGLLGPAPIAC
jgi:hypothetical protein